MCEDGVGALEWFLEPSVTVCLASPSWVCLPLPFSTSSFLCFNSDSPGDPPLPPEPPTVTHDAGLPHSSHSFPFFYFCSKLSGGGWWGGGPPGRGLGAGLLL